jgi:hypothetical protein
MRRPADTGVATLPVLASGDDEQLTVLAWNEGSSAETITLSLRNVAPSLVGRPLQVKRFGYRIRNARCPGVDPLNANHDVTCWEDAIPAAALASSLHTTLPITIGPGETVMAFAGTPPAYGSTTWSNQFVRSESLVVRNGTDAAPRGTGHFDPRTGAMTVAARAGGDAAVKVTLRNVGDALPVSIRMAAQGALSATTTVAGIRVDYLDAAHRPAKTVFFRDARYTGASVPWSRLSWPPAGTNAEVVSNLCGTSCTRGAGTGVTLDLLGNAPVGWDSVRDVVVGVVLTGGGTDAIYRVDLP